jgi:cell division septal protein FtsQ
MDRDSLLLNQRRTTYPDKGIDHRSLEVRKCKGMVGTCVVVLFVPFYATGLLLLVVMLVMAAEELIENIELRGDQQRSEKDNEREREEYIG